MKRTHLIALMLSLGVGRSSAQLATFDAVQEGNALKQLGNDIKKLANDEMSIAQRVAMLAKLDLEILRQTALMQQAYYQATHFSTNLKQQWIGAGNLVVSNWTTPNYYGETSGWGAAVNNGSAAPDGWKGTVLTMQRGLYIAMNPITVTRNLAQAATVNTFDGAGPVALQTIGNARQQQIQIDGAIGRLQTTALSEAEDMNSEVEQLNLLNAAQLIHLRQQQTLSTLNTSLLEQQTIANKLHRDQIADQMNFTDQFQRYAVSQGITLGDAEKMKQ